MKTESREITLEAEMCEVKDFAQRNMLDKWLSAKICVSAFV